MNNELREAAERLRRWRLLGGMETEQVIWSGSSTTRCAKISEDQDLVMKAYLAENHPDDNEPVDKAWLRSILIEGGEFQYHDQMPDFLNLYNDDFDIGLESMKNKPITRGQVRLLLRALA